MTADQAKLLLIQGKKVYATRFLPEGLYMEIGINKAGKAMPFYHYPDGTTEESIWESISGNGWETFDTNDPTGIPTLDRQNIGVPDKPSFNIETQPDGSHTLKTTPSQWNGYYTSAATDKALYNDLQQLFKKYIHYDSLKQAEAGSTLFWNVINNIKNLIADIKKERNEPKPVSIQTDMPNPKPHTENY